MMGSVYRIVTTGSRFVYDPIRVTLAFEMLAKDIPEGGVLHVAQGEATGMDLAVRVYCKQHDVQCDGFFADWDQHKRAAGGIRNSEMLVAHNPHLVLAFPCPKSIGTWDCVRKAALMNMLIRIYPVKPR